MRYECEYRVALRLPSLQWTLEFEGRGREFSFAFGSPWKPNANEIAFESIIMCKSNRMAEWRDNLSKVEKKLSIRYFVQFITEKSLQVHALNLMDLQLLL